MFQKTEKSEVFKKESGLLRIMRGETARRWGLWGGRGSLCETASEGKARS